MQVDARACRCSYSTVLCTSHRYTCQVQPTPVQSCICVFRSVFSNLVRTHIVSRRTMLSALAGSLRSGAAIFGEAQALRQSICGALQTSLLTGRQGHASEALCEPSTSCAQAQQLPAQRRFESTSQAQQLTGAYTASQASISSAGQGPDVLQSTPGKETTAEWLSRPGMEELLRAVIHSVPISKSGARALNSALIQPKGTSNMAFLDPEQTLATTMRALQVIKQVLRQNGHVYIHNANKSTQPILIAAARSCLNSNVWFATEAWKVGCLSDERLGSALFTPKHQPNRALLQNRSAPWTNSLCPSPDPVQKQKPCLESIDKLRLLARTRDRSLRSEGVTDPSQGVGFLKEVVHSETFSARLTLPGSATGPASQLSLLVVMDLSYGIDAIEEAHSHGIPTIALVNAHKDLSQITYPVLAAESHLAFHHFFLDWILKVVNLPETQ